MKKILSLVLSVSIMANLCACSNTETNNSNDNNSKNEEIPVEKIEEPQEDKIEIICDITKFANISGEELISILGEPDEIEDTTPAVGFVDIPCQYYEYYNHEEIGEASFILINDNVAKFITYKEFPFDEDTILESLNVKPSDDCVIVSDTGFATRYRCLTDQIDDLSIELIEDDKFGFISVIYDMLYFEEWYLPMSVSEQSNYQYWTQETVKALLKSPKSADFPNILKWSFGKNKFYVAVSSYVDAQNSFGAELRSEFTFVYQANTQNVVYAIFDGEVIYDNGYVPTADLIVELVNNTEAVKEKQNNQTTESVDNIGALEPTKENSTTQENTQPQTIQSPENTGSPKNNLADLEYLVSGTCEKYNSGDNWRNGRLYGTVNSPYEITIEHYIQDILTEEDIEKIPRMEDAILDTFSSVLNEVFPEEITVWVYSTYSYYEDSYEYDWDEESDLDGIVEGGLDIFGSNTPIPEELWDE